MEFLYKVVFAKPRQDFLSAAWDDLIILHTVVPPIDGEGGHVTLGVIGEITQYRLMGGVFEKIEIVGDGVAAPTSLSL